MVMPRAGRVNPPGHVRSRAPALAILIVGSMVPIQSTSLRVRVVAAGVWPGESTIVGRATCGPLVWLLNDARALVAVSPDTRTTVVRALQGLRAEEKPWGLGCSDEGHLWTLATPRTIARLTPHGVVAERVDLAAPFIGLFGEGGGLLLAPVPPSVGGPVLVLKHPNRPRFGRPWPALRARAAPHGTSLLARNLVRCGLGADRAIPCWFTDSADVVVADPGRTLASHSVPVRGADVDATAPLRDFAFAGRDRAWILATGARLHAGRSTGRRLLLAALDGRELGRVDLDPPGRLLLAASARSCLVLTVTGDILEVTP
jgi:hypothetical protein